MSSRFSELPGEVARFTASGAVPVAQSHQRTVERAGSAADRLLLSTLPAASAERRLALAVVIVSTLVFAAAAPYAKQQLQPIAAFLPAYQSALIVVEVLTAVLLFGQYRIVRSRGLLLLAGAYLFSASMALVHALSFPGLFLPSGLLGAGPQTTAWIYFLWHTGFPLLVIVYALTMKERRPGPRVAVGASSGILACAGLVLAVVAALALLTTAGHDLLPRIMAGNRDAPAKVVIATVSWMTALAALPVLWRRQPHSVLDLWLMVVMCVWVYEVALAAVLNGGRFDLGWYAGRVYGLLAGSFVLVVLLLENARLHARLARADARHVERLRILNEIDRAVVAEQPVESIAGAVIQPLRELLGVPRAIVNRFELDSGEVEWIAAAGRRRVHGPGVRYSIALMGDVAALGRGETQLVSVAALPRSAETEALLASDVRYYLVVPMIAGEQLLGALSFGGPGNVFPSEQVDIAREVATQLAVALVQARLLDRVKQHAAELEERVRQRTCELEATNKELESFSYSVSHDLRAPLRAVDGYARMLEEDYGTRLDEEGRRLLGVVRGSSARMGQLIDDLLAFSRLGRREPARRSVDMTALAREVAAELNGAGPARVELGSLPEVSADPALLRQVWQNLIGNALKYSGKRQDARIEIGGRKEAAESIYWVRDNGVGFDPRYAGKLFGVFQRLHRDDEFPGTGVGLAIVQRVVTRHGGRAWAESRPGEGACFYFALPQEAA